MTLRKFFQKFCDKSKSTFSDPLDKLLYKLKFPLYYYLIGKYILKLIRRKHNRNLPLHCLPKILSKPDPNTSKQGQSVLHIHIPLRPPSRLLFLSLNFRILYLWEKDRAPIRIQETIQPVFPWRFLRPD